MFNLSLLTDNENIPLLPSLKLEHPELQYVLTFWGEPLNLNTGTVHYARGKTSTLSFQLRIFFIIIST